MDYVDIFINLANNIETKKDKEQIENINIDRLNRIVQESRNRVLYYLQDGSDRAFVSEELMHVPEDTQVPPNWVSEWK